MENHVTTLLYRDEKINLKEKIGIVWKLSIPAILAQISEIIMQYIDAGMVGSLGAEATASIGLVSSSTWLFGGLISACCSGFSVQVAHAIGAKNYAKARSIFRESIIAVFIYCLCFTIVGMMIAPHLPQWLGAEEIIWQDASNYFMLFCAFLVIRGISTLSMQMLQCSGNMRIPSIFLSLACFLDVIFNYFLIFPSRTINIFNKHLFIFGTNLGVLGAQLGTSLSILVAGAATIYYATRKNEILALHIDKGRWLPEKIVVQEALRIGGPMALQQAGLSFAQVISTRIVAPLGTIAIAANSFAVTVESLCYMPGFGISQAATTIVGQAFGAKRKDLAKSFAWLTVALGMVIMTLGGIIMYFICPYIFAMLTPVQQVRELGAQVLRIELFVEALFAASIVSTGALRGSGDTLVVGIINVSSMWIVRLTIAAFLAPRIGLSGVWIAMAIDNSVAGILLLIRLARGNWLKRMDEFEVQ